MPDPDSMWWLAIMVAAVIGLLAGCALTVYVVNQPSFDSAPSNVVQLPPLAARSGPTHVVARPRVFDFEQEPA